MRKISAQRQQYLHPINSEKSVFDLKQIEGIQANIKELEPKIDSIIKENDLKELIRNILN